MTAATFSHAAERPASILRPFAIMAAWAFTIGFLAVMAVTGVSVLAQLGELPHARHAARAEGAAPVASPANSGAVSSDWNFPKAI